MPIVSTKGALRSRLLEVDDTEGADNPVDHFGQRIYADAIEQKAPYPYVAIETTDDSVLNALDITTDLWHWDGRLKIFGDGLAGYNASLSVFKRLNDFKGTIGTIQITSCRLQGQRVTTAKPRAGETIGPTMYAQEWSVWYKRV